MTLLRNLPHDLISKTTRPRNASCEAVKDVAECCFSLTGTARYLGKSTRWVQYQLTGLRPIPGYKIGKSWIFKKSEIDRWLEQFRAKSDVDAIVDEVVSELSDAR